MAGIPSELVAAGVGVLILSIQLLHVPDIPQQL